MRPLLCLFRSSLHWRPLLSSHSRWLVSAGVSSEKPSLEKQLEVLRPSGIFMSRLRKEELSKMEKLLKELEVYVYMGTYIPQRLTDDDWKRLMSIDDLRERVNFLNVKALTHRREEKDILREERRKQKALEVKKEIEMEEEKFARGEMGYGPDLYRLVNNQLRNKRRVQNVQGSRVWASLRVPEMPQIAVDMQYLFTTERGRGKQGISTQVQYIISENLDRRRPLPLLFVNFPPVDHAQEWLVKTVGFYGGQYTHQTILPDFTEKGLRESFPNRKIYYLSRAARDYLDGPLEDAVYTLCASFDGSKESLGASRRENVKAVRLPLHKYVQWKRGAQNIPLPNVIRILEEVHMSGGDWHTALHRFISGRHLRESDEGDEISAALRRERHARKEELIRLIAEATGQPVPMMVIVLHEDASVEIPFDELKTMSAADVLAKVFGTDTSKIDSSRLAFCGRLLDRTAVLGELEGLEETQSLRVLQSPPAANTSISTLDRSKLKELRRVLSAIQEQEHTQLTMALLDQLSDPSHLRRQAKEFPALLEDQAACQVINDQLLILAILGDEEDEQRRAFLEAHPIIVNVLHSMLQKAYNPHAGAPFARLASRAPRPQAEPAEPIITPEMLQRAMQEALGAFGQAAPGPAVAPATPPSHASVQQYAAQLEQLREFGFTDDAQNLSVLAATDGNVEQALELLITMREEQG